MIREKALIRAMKDAWRAGYHVAENGGRFFLRADRWQLGIERAAMPRKALALLVEHIGELPENMAYITSKRDNAQTEILGAELEIHEDAAREMGDYNAGIQITPLYFQGYRVWQAMGSYEAELLCEPMTDIIDLSKITAATISRDRKRVYFSGSAGYFATSTVTSDAYAEAMKHLSAFPWTGE